jgi:hypothetical protein
MSEQTFLYIIGEPEPCWNVKIGITSNIGSRLSQLQPGHPSRLVVHRSYAFDERYAAFRAERQAHEFFDDARMCGEWFDITPEEAIMGIEEAHTWPVSAR